MLQPGIIGEENVLVTSENTAAALASGALEVFATPAMIALMECTAMRSVEPFLEDGFTTVGTALDVKHLSATPKGMKVCCKSELVTVDSRRLVFKVSASDEKGLIGEGTHERFIVNIEKFIKKTSDKLC